MTFADALPRLHELLAMTAYPDTYAAYGHRKFDEAVQEPARRRAWTVRELELLDPIECRGSE